MKIWQKIRRRILSGRGNHTQPAFQAHSFKNVEIMRGTLVSGENVIGEHTYVGFNCVITASSIGRYCSIANNVSVGVGEHKIHRVSTSSLFYARPFQTLTDGKCTIGNDVWLGSNVVVRRGVTIGDGAIVGANSFVNKDVKPFEIVGGIPARTIKMRFTDDKIRMIQESKWWEKNLEEAKVIIAHLEKQGLFETDAQ